MNNNKLSRMPNGENGALSSSTNCCRALTSSSVCFFHLKGTFTVEDAALYLGITPSHLYKLVRKYDIPHSRPTNGRIFFNKEDLDKWIKSRMVFEPETIVQNELGQQHECYY